MHSSHFTLKPIAFLLFVIMQIQGQVTGEGNAPFDTSSNSAMTITLTDSTEPSGSKPTNYYSSVYPQALTTPPSESSTAGSISSASTSSSTHNIILAVVLSLVLSCILFAVTIFLIRRRMYKTSVARRRRANWILKSSQWSPDQKQGPESSPFRNPTDPSAYPFAAGPDAKVPVLPPRVSTFASNRGV